MHIKSCLNWFSDKVTYLAIIISLFFTCGLTAGKSVYVSGSYGVGEKEQACYWVDGKRVDLEGDGNNHSLAEGICVEGAVVYTVGRYNNGKRNVACYWTGNKRTDLPDSGKGNSWAGSIYVKNGVVYAAGYDSVKKKNIPCLWVDMKLIPLEGERIYSESADSIYVDDGVIYTAGYYLVKNKYMPCYWRDGKKVELSVRLGKAQRIYSASTYGIYVDGENVYTCGTIMYDDDLQGDKFSKACYWTGAERADIEYGAMAESIWVYNGTVYMGGSCSIGDKEPACIWIGKKRYVLEKDIDGDVPAIHVDKGVIYAAGEIADTVCFWINGKKTILPSGDKWGAVTGIDVK